MKIDEILSVQTPDDEFTHTMSEYERKFKKFGKSFLKIGDGDISFFLEKTDKVLLAVKDDIVLGFLELNDHGDNFFETYGLYVRPGFRGGIGLKMYEALLNHGKFLVSGDSQTTAGEAMWSKLFNLSGVKLFVYDPEIHNTFANAIKKAPVKSVSDMRKAYFVDEDGDDGERRLIAVK